MTSSAVHALANRLRPHGWITPLYRAMTHRCTIAGAIFVLLISCAASMPVSARQTQESDGRGRYIFSNWDGPPIPVWYQVPDSILPDTPVVVVMHGVNRDADRYRDEWAALAKDYGLIVIVPEFSETDFPGSLGYNTGFFIGADATPRPRNLWSFAVIEPLFDEARRRFSTAVPRYTLYGHSAGGQFVHRFVMAMPEARIERAISANAGWYTMPDPNIAFPYGVSGAPITEDHVAAALGKPLLVLLGTADTDTNDPNLRKTREANLQGPHRYSRGKRFFAAGQAVAARLGIPFAWTQEDVVGTGHQNRLMAEAAAKKIAGARDRDYNKK